MSFLDTAAQEYDDAVSRWRDAVMRFDSAYSEFLANRDASYSVGMGDDWNKLDTYAASVKGTILDIAGKLRGAYSWVRDFFGFGETSQLNGLGVVFPLIPAAVIAGSIATVVMVTGYLVTHNDTVRERMAERVARGELTAEEADSLLNRGTVVGAITETSRNVLMIVALGALIYFAPKLLGNSK